MNKTPRQYRANDQLDRIGGAGGGIYKAVVKRNDDWQFMGRLAVWIPEFGGDPRNESHWFIVSYASPFAGVTDPKNLVENSTTMDGSQMSYGWWAIPPDIENEVLVCFVNGNTQTGFWFACVYGQNMNKMVPGISSGTPALPPDQQTVCGSLPPVVEYNKYSTENPKAPRRPIFEPLHNGLSSQGLYSDDERGPSTTSARREAPSKVFGYNTPRGNTIHVDDNPANEFIRMRTRSGAQVLVHETTGYVYINSKDGNSWIEVSDKGVDVYSRGAVSLRSEGSLNLHADGSLNIEADGNLNLRAGGNLTMQSAHNIAVAGNGTLAIEFGGAVSARSGGVLALSASGNLQLGAGGNISSSSAGSNIRSAAQIEDNSDVAAPAPETIDAVVEQPRDLSEVNGEAPCYQQDTRKTIVRRMPTHEPYAGHPSLTNSGPDDLSSGEFASAGDAANTTPGTVPEGGEAADLTNIDATELDWLVACMIDEASTQVADGKAAVAQIIKNRMSAKTNSDGTIKGTVLRKDQFSGFYFDNVNGRYQRVCSTVSEAEKRGLQKIAKYRRNAALWASCTDIGKKVMAGSYTGAEGFQRLRANKRATMYLNYAVTQKLNPGGSWTRWATPAKFVAKIDDHSFYYA